MQFQLHLNLPFHSHSIFSHSRPFLSPQSNIISNTPHFSSHLPTSLRPLTVNMQFSIPTPCSSRPNTNHITNFMFHTYFSALPISYNIFPSSHHTFILQPNIRPSHALSHLSTFQTLLLTIYIDNTIHPHPILI